MDTSNLMEQILSKDNLNQAYLQVVRNKGAEEVCTFLQTEVSSSVDIAKVKDRSICPCCGKSALTIKRGIEVGNIFQLGTKYTKSMNMQYVDRDGEVHNPIMGCY